MRGARRRASAPRPTRSARTPERRGPAAACRVALGASLGERSGGRVRGGVGDDEVHRLSDRLDALGLVFGDPDAVAVLELHDELDEVERIGFQVLFEPALLPDLRSIDSELLGQVRCDPLQHLLARRTARRTHERPGKLSAPTDAASRRSPVRSTPAAASESEVLRTTSSSTPRSASAIAFAIARRLELPWQTTTRPRSPSR